MKAWIPAMALAALACAGCQEKPTPGAPLAVTTQQVAAGGDERGARYTATIRPYAQVDLAFKVGGYVEDVLQVRGVDGRPRHVQDGDVVRRGTVLARVRDREQGDAHAQARAALAQARADFDRVSQLYESRSVSKADYDAAYTRYTAARAQEDQAAVSVADCALRTPLDGQVFRRAVEVGTLVAAGSPAFTVSDLSSVKVVFGVPDVQVAAIPLGAPQTVHVEAAPGKEFHGRITRVAPSADPSSRTYEAEVTIPNRDGRLRAGMIAWLTLPGGAAGARTTVPLAAVVRPPGETEGFAVYVTERRQGRWIARLRRVELGEMRGERIEVAAGLDGGEHVIVRGATLAVDGRDVRIVP